MPDIRKCCGTLSGRDPHRRGCPNAWAARYVLAGNPIPAGEDLTEDSDDPAYVKVMHCRVKRITAKAVLIQQDGVTHWIPRSMIRFPETMFEGMAGNIEVRDWFARRVPLY